MRLKDFSLLLLACIAVCIIATAGCADSSATSAEEEKDVYIVGVDGEYEPFAYVTKDGEVTGMDVESMKWIAEKKGLNVTFQPMQWDGIIVALQTGKIDIIYSGLSITEERAEKVAFSRPYLTINQSVAVYDGEGATMDEFYAGNLTIGAQRGTTGEYWVEENLIDTGLMPKQNLVLYDSFPLVVADLQNKRMDAAIYDISPMKKAIEGKTLVIIGEIDTDETYGVAVGKDNPELLATINEGLDELQADPYWDELKAKYGLD